jgi:hypothetical protein
MNSELKEEIRARLNKVSGMDISEIHPDFFITENDPWPKAICADNSVLKFPHFISLLVKKDGGVFETGVITGCN